jgi:hypothetical protein
MSSSNPNESPALTQALRFLCSDHLQHEASVLQSALRLVRAMDTAFRQHSSNLIAPTVNRHAEVAALMEELNRRRAHFRASAARLLKLAPDAVKFSVILNQLSARERPAVATEMARVRVMAEELAAINYRVSIFLRIHLDAYRRILRDLTNSRQGSGRYGPTGSTESHEYRPLIQIHG